MTAQTLETAHNPAVPDRQDAYAPFGALAVRAEELHVSHRFAADRYLEIGDGILGLAEYHADGSQAAHDFTVADKKADLAGMTAERSLLERDNMLMNARVQIAKLDPEAHRDLGTYIINEVPKVLLDAYAGWKREKPDTATVSDWLIEVPASGDETEAPLLNVLQWHNHRNESINRDPENLARIERLRTEYVEKVTAAVARGDLPELVLERLQSVQSVPILVGDEFDTIFKGHEGQYTDEHGVMLSAGFTDHVVLHELTHAVMGGLARADLSEALTDHFVVIIQSGNPEDINPYTRRDGNLYYLYRKQLLAAELRGGKKEIPISTALNAYLEPGYGGPLEKEFMAAIDESYGMDVQQYVYDQLLGSFERLSQKNYTLAEYEKLSNSSIFEEAIGEVAIALRAYGAYAKGEQVGDDLYDVMSAEHRTFVKGLKVEHNRRVKWLNAVNGQAYDISERVKSERQQKEAAPAAPDAK